MNRTVGYPGWYPTCSMDTEKSCILLEIRTKQCIEITMFHFHFPRIFQLRPDFRVCPQLKEHSNKKSIKHSKQPLLRHERGQRQARADDQIHCDTDIPWCQSTPTKRMRFFLTTNGLLYMFNKARLGDPVVKPSKSLGPWGRFRIPICNHPCALSAVSRGFQSGKNNYCKINHLLNINLPFTEHICIWVFPKIMVAPNHQF